MPVDDLIDEYRCKGNSAKLSAPPHDAKRNNIDGAEEFHLLPNLWDGEQAFRIEGVAKEAIKDHHGPHDALVVSKASIGI